MFRVGLVAFVVAGALGAISAAFHDGERADHVAVAGAADETPPTASAPPTTASADATSTTDVMPPGPTTTLDAAFGPNAGNEATGSSAADGSLDHSSDGPNSDPVGSFVVSCSISTLTVDAYATVDIPCSVRSVGGYEGAVSLECDYPPQDQHCFLPDSVLVHAGKTAAFTFRFKNDNNSQWWGFPLILTGRDWPLRSDYTIKVNEHRTRLESCGTFIPPGGVSCVMRWDPDHLATATLDVVESSPEFTCTAGGNGTDGQPTEGSASPGANETGPVGISCTGPHSANAPVTLRVTVDGHTDSYRFKFS